MEEDIDYLAPYLARAGNPSDLSGPEAQEVAFQCLEEFKEIMIKRANKIQSQFDEVSPNISFPPITPIIADFAKIARRTSMVR